MKIKQTKNTKTKRVDGFLNGFCVRGLNLNLV